MVDKSIIESPSYPYAIVTAMNLGYNSEIGALKEDDDKLVLQGIRVRYVSSKEQVSEIVTDITVNIPKPEVVATAAVTDIFEYAIIGDKGIEVEAGNLNINGNAYAGFDSQTNSAFTISPNVNVWLNDKTFIANGKLSVGKNSMLTTSSKQKLWAENILLDSSSVDFNGATYVADDLTLNGSRSNAKISGIYKGYGRDKTVAGSSSAIINGTDNSINMSGAREVSLAGYSYIATSNEKLRANKTAVESSQNTDIKMGESIAIKGNQIAYLMPGEWIGTDSNSVSKFGHNPLSYKEYKELLDTKDSSDKNYTLVNTEIKSYKTGKSLKDYGIDSSNLDDNYSKIFVQPINGISSEGLVYFYINLPQDKAAQYFNDYYNADKNSSKELNKHTAFYTTSIQSTSESNIRTAGNYSIVNGDLTVMPGKSGAGSNSDKYFREYNSLCTNLSTEIVAGQKVNEVFNNIMNTSVLNTYLGVNGSKEVSVKGVKAIITTGNYVYDNHSGDVKLIVAKGDVNIRQRFTGSVIAGGKITINAADEINTDKSGVLKQLLREPLTTGGDDYLYKIFKNGDALATASSAENANILFADGSVDVSKLISYSNWKKNS